MQTIKTVLSNGLTLLVTEIPSSQSATVTVWVKTGSRYETPEIYGLSHFLEHMVFKGSKKRPSARAISEAVDGFGGEFNAGTTKEWTEFYIKARQQKMNIAFDVLSDMVLNPTILESEIEKEKNVILSEMAMYEDMPMRKIGEYFENMIYGGSSLEPDIIGNKNSVIGITKENFETFRNKFYFAQNILVTITGNITLKKAETLANQYFGGLKAGEFTPRKDAVVNHQTKKLFKKKDTDQTHIYLGFPGFSYGSKNRYTEGVMATLLGGGMSSRLFLEVREKRSLVYTVSCGVEHYHDTGYIASYAGTDHKKASEAVKVIKEEYFKLASNTHDISEKELSKAKEFLKGHLALSLEDTKDINDFVALDEIYTGVLRTIDEIYAKVDAVTADEVNALAKEVFSEDKCYLTVVGPQDLVTT